MRNEFKEMISKCRVNDDPSLAQYDLSEPPTFKDQSLELLYEYITQRYSIYKQREVFNYHKDEWYKNCNDLFKEYKFTNIFREDDRVSRYLIVNITRSTKMSVSDKFWRTILFRLYNRIDTAESLQIATDPQLWNRSPEVMRGRADLINHDAYTRAFKTVGLKLQMSKYCEDRKILGPYYFVRSLREDWIHWENTDERVEDPDRYPIHGLGKFRSNLTAQQLFDWFKSFPGIGNFFAYQLFVDITYIRECPVSENYFVVAGPGCVSGLNQLFESWGSLKSHSELLHYLSNNIERLFQENVNPWFDLSELLSDRPSCAQRLGVMSLENIFCEFSKFLYVRLGTGRTKRYHPYKD